MLQDSTQVMTDTTTAIMDTVQQYSDQVFDEAMNSPEMQDATSGGLMAIMAMGAGFMIFMLACLVLMIIAMWKIHTKAGQPGWACIVPIYNIIVLLRIVGKPWWWLFLLCIPLVNLIFLIIVYNKLSKSFGYGAGFTIGLIFLGIIFFPILAFGSSKYVGPGGQPAAAA